MRDSALVAEHPVAGQVQEEEISLQLCGLNLFCCRLTEYLFKLIKVVRNMIIVEKYLEKFYPVRVA